MTAQALEVSELQSSINALRRQNWSQLPDRAPLDLVDPVVVHTSSATSATGGCVGATLPPVAATTPTSAVSTPSRNSGNSNPNVWWLISTAPCASD